MRPGIACLRERLGALRAVPAGQDPGIDTLRDQTVVDLEQLIDRAKAEGSLRPDRWIEDISLALSLKEMLASSGASNLRSISARFPELTIAALAPDATPPGPAEEPDSVLALRRTLGHEIAGLPLAE